MINVEIVTPEKKVVDEMVDSVTVPTVKGEIGILPNHAPLISTLRPGILNYSNKGENEQMVVAGGFIEVSGDKVSVLADIAESKEDIDVEAAKFERDETQKLFADWKGSEEEFDFEMERLEKAQARLQLTASR